MAWDKTNPQGATKISVGDNAIRDNNEAIEDALAVEHNFATGADSVQTGRHSFGVDAVSARDMATPVYVDGSIFFANNVRSGQKVLQIRSGGVWQNCDVEPVSGGSFTLPRLNAQSRWIVTQHSVIASVTPTGATPNVLFVRGNESPYRHATIVNATRIDAPINFVANYSSTICLELLMDSSGPHTITWGFGLHSSSGVAPVIALGNNTITILYFTRLLSGNWLVTSLPDVRDIV